MKKRFVSFFFDSSDLNTSKNRCHGSGLSFFNGRLDGKT
jgi:hypothetical protein